MKCERCGAEMTQEECYAHLGQSLCEDCYMEAIDTHKPCEPWAVYLAGRTREASGASGVEDLTEVQQKIYDMVTRRGKSTVAELKEELGLSESQADSNLATLRHCELVKGRREGDVVYIVPFSP